ncbi:MAG: B12-binding domain-containing radical SAM protein [Candidatus Omnitrophica bacterium]|nr:B12-binding domain-containing radical SAM protein [Candidatus Omnitrophota bacterium]
MNIALIRPPKITGAFEKILIQEPINLVYLAAFLNANGFNTVIWDFEVEQFSQQIIARRIADNNISIAGITSMTPTINNAHNIANLIKLINPAIVTIAGGAHVSAIPEQSLNEFPGFDYLVLREGEIALLKLCQSIRDKKSADKISGLAFLKNKQAVINHPAEEIEDLDSLPFPDRKLLNRDLYKNMYAAGINISNKRATVVFTSRGCSQDCTFCAVKKTSGPKVRFRSAENVIAELKQCKDMGYNHITFEDTNLTLNQQRFIQICNGLKILGLTWDCQTKVNMVNKQLISLMKDCGCLKIAYGVESGSPKILKLMKKNITLEQIKQAFELTHQAGIVTCAFFILGSHPEETAQDIKLTEQIIKKIKPDVFQLGIICPYPGTEIYDIMQEYGLIKDIDWNKFNFMHSVPPWGTKHLTAQQLVKFQKQIYTRYLFSWHFIGFFCRKMLNPKQLPQLCKLSFYMLKYLLFEKRN